MLTFGLPFVANKAIVGNHVLYQAAQIWGSWILFQEDLVCHHFTLQTCHVVGSVDWGESFTFASNHLQELLPKVLHVYLLRLIFLRNFVVTLKLIQSSSHIRYVNWNVRNAQHNLPSVTFNCQTTTLLYLMTQPQESLASRIKVACIFENVETYDVTAEKRVQNFGPQRKHLEDITGWKWRMHRKANTHVNIFVSKQMWKQQKLIVVDPDKTAALARCVNSRHESLVNSLIFSPQIFAFRFVQCRSQQLVIVEKRLQYFVAKLGKLLHCLQI